MPSIVNNELLLTTAANGEATSAFFNTAQAVNNFTASFTYNFISGTTPPADGFAFVLQNNNLNALGGGGGALGYLGGTLGDTKSAALAFDLWNDNNQAGVTRSGISASGTPFFYYTDTTPVALRLTVPVNITISFNDGVFTETLTQGVNTITKSFNINVLDRVGPAGFVGFSGGTGGANAEQKITNFSYTVGNAPGVAPRATALTGVPEGGFGTFGIREVLGAANCCGDLNQAQAAILANTGTSQIDYTAPVLNLYDSDVRGSFRGDSRYMTDPDQVNDGTDTVNNIAVLATGTIRIPTTGVYTFGTNSDDGFRVIIEGQRFETAAGQGGTSINANGALEFTGGRGAGTPSIGSIFLNAGDYKIQMLNWEGGGGASVELYASPGAKNAFDFGTFSLIGGAGIPARSGKNHVTQVAEWSLKEYSNVANVDEVLTNGRTGSGTQRGSTTLVSTIHFNDPEGANNGSHGADAAAFPNDTPGVGDDNYGAFATTTLTIAPADVGRYTFMVFTDDQSRFRIIDSLSGIAVQLVGNIIGDPFDSDGNGTLDQFGTNGCCFDQFGHYDLAAGTYNIEAAFREGGGGSGFFIYGTQGERDTFDPNAFQLLGANVDGSTWSTDAAAALQLVPEPGAASMLGLAAVGLIARRRRRRQN